jgi:hypothetical protein
MDGVDICAFVNKISYIRLMKKEKVFGEKMKKFRKLQIMTAPEKKITNIFN